MENWSRKEVPKTIIRLEEVLRRTGLSRSTIYTRIANSEFPRQISLGARSVGWVEEEVDGWIRRRVVMRPASESENWSLNEDPKAATTSEISSRGTPIQKKSTRNSSQTETPEPRRNLTVPDLAQLELIGTNVYVDKVTGTRWFQVLRPKHSTD
jgi:prophage regulatory protein